MFREANQEDRRREQEIYASMADDDDYTNEKFHQRVWDEIGMFWGADRRPYVMTSEPESGIVGLFDDIMKNKATVGKDGMTSKAPVDLDVNLLGLDYLRENPEFNDPNKPLKGIVHDKEGGSYYPDEHTISLGTDLSYRPEENVEQMGGEEAMLQFILGHEFTHSDDVGTAIADFEDYGKLEEFPAEREFDLLMSELTDAEKWDAEAKAAFNKPSNLANAYAAIYRARPRESIADWGGNYLTGRGDPSMSPAVAFDRTQEEVSRFVREVRNKRPFNEPEDDENPYMKALRERIKAARQPEAEGTTRGQ